jgi:hypothetical protein
MSYLTIDLSNEWSHILTIFLSPYHELLYIHIHSPWTFLRSRLCILSSNNTPLIYWWNCYSWYSIFSRSSLTHRYCFNSLSRYITPIDMKPVELVLNFHKWISVKNTAISSIYSRSYAQDIGAIRICKLCWPSYLHYFYISGCGPPIEVNLIGVVLEFHKFHSVQNSSSYVAYTESYARNFGGSRICQHCWHSHLV